MLAHNLKLILRGLWSRRIHSFIILLSLTIGFACTNILISFLVFETNADTFHANKDRTFQVFSNDPFGGDGLVAYVPDYFFDYLTNYPEVRNVCQISNLDQVAIKTSPDGYAHIETLSVDTSFFSIFDFPTLNGGKGKCLTASSIVLSNEKAIALFGRTDITGRLLTIVTPDTTRELIISAVVTKPHENSHLHFDALVHHSVFPKKWNGGATYVLLNSRDSDRSLREKIQKDAQRPGLVGLGKMDYFFNPLTNSYFNTDNKFSFMRVRDPLFLTVGYVVCALVFFIAVFNFINLVLLSWQNRRKEIGIKKTLGVTRDALFVFSMTEAWVYVLASFMISSIVTFYFIPVFNNVFETNLSPEYILNVKVLIAILVVVMLTGFLVVFLSVAWQWSMKAVSLMAHESSKVRFNNTLFTVQFMVSITLAICSVTIVRQMNHIEKAPLGFNRHIVQLNSPDRKSRRLLPALKQKIAQLPDVKSIAVGNGNPIFGSRIARYDLDDGQFYTPYLLAGDEDYLKTLDLKLTEGEFPSEKNPGRLVNRKLVRQFGLKKPIGEKIPGTKELITGVVEDFTCGSFRQEIPPVIISFQKEGEALLIDYRGNNLAKTLPQIQSVWKDLFPDHAFNHRIIQEELMKKYKADTFLYKIIITFSIVSMVLSCFGLFALSWAVVQNRTKEMGIRKVLGATPLDILNLLTVMFIKRILLAFLIASPLGYYLMKQWLSRFANRIELDGWTFCLSGLIVLLIAAMTLSLQSVKVAMTNPVDEIRNE